MRVAPGIARDAAGYSTRVQVGAGDDRLERERRWPHGADLRLMKDWIAKTRTQLRQRAPLTRIGRGTVAADVVRYLETIRALPSWVSRRADLRAWLPRFNDRSRAALARGELTEQLHDWRTEGVSAHTVNHRRNALIMLFEGLDGPDLPAAGPNVARQTPHMRPPPLQARDISSDLRTQILRAMRPGKARALWAVMAATGLPPARIRELTPADVDLEAGTVFLLGRKKGEGTQSRTLPLTVEGVAAFRAFARLKAWGGVARQTLTLCFGRGLAAVNVMRARAGLPPMHVRPYDARHAFGARIYRETGDLRAAAELLDVSQETALRYTLAAVPERLRAVVAVLDGARARGQSEDQTWADAEQQNRGCP